MAFPSHTSAIKGTDYETIIKKECGLTLEESISKRTINITQLLKHREIGMHKTATCSKRTKSRVINNYLPNYMIDRMRFNETIFHSMFSPDGNIFLISSYEGNIKLFNSQNGSYQFYQNIQSTVNIYDIAISPDNNYIACTNRNSELSLFHLNYNSRSRFEEEIFSLGLEQSSYLHSIRYSTNGKELLLAGERNIIIFDLNENRFLWWNHFKNFAAAFADNSSQIFYTGGIKTYIEIWDRRIFNTPCTITKPVAALFGHTSDVYYIDSKGDGRYLISKSLDQTIKLWDIRKASKSIRRRSMPLLQFQQPLRRFSSDSNLYLSTVPDMSLMTYTGSHLTLEEDNTPVRFSPLETTGQRYIYTGGIDGNIVVYDSLTGYVHQIQQDSSPRVHVSWHPTRNEILTTSFYGDVSKWIYDSMDD